MSTEVKFKLKGIKGIEIAVCNRKWKSQVMQKFAQK